MQNTFLLIAIVSLWTLGINLATKEGEVLYGLKRGLQNALGEKWAQPFISCPYCMPSVHGLLICTLYHFYRYHFYHIYPLWIWAALQWIFIVAASSTVNYIFFNLIRLLIGYANLFDGCSEVSDIEAEIKTPDNG